MLKNPQAAQKGPAARRRPRAAREAYFLYVERAVEGANEAGGPFSVARSVLLLDLPGEALHRVLAHHGFADGVLARDHGDGQVLAALDLVEVHVHDDLMVLLPDALAADVGVVDAHALLRFRHLVGVEALHLLHRRRPE